MPVRSRSSWVDGCFTGAPAVAAEVVSATAVAATVAVVAKVAAAVTSRRVKARKALKVVGARTPVMVVRP